MNSTQNDFENILGFKQWSLQTTLKKNIFFNTKINTMKSFILKKWCEYMGFLMHRKIYIFLLRQALCTWYFLRKSLWHTCFPFIMSSSICISCRISLRNFEFIHSFRTLSQMWSRLFSKNYVGLKRNLKRILPFLN